MKEPDWAHCTEEQLWKYVASYLAKNGIDTVLVGGAVVAIYTEGAYRSGDLDLEEAVAEYKSISKGLAKGVKRDQELMNRFLKFLERYRKCGNN